MDTAQCIQIIFSVALVLGTVALALITYGYMKSTKKMADSMNQQSEMMQKEFEIRLMPLVEEKVHTKSTGISKPTAEFRIANKGIYAVYCGEIEIKIKSNENENDFVVENMNIGQWLESRNEITREISFDLSRLSSIPIDRNTTGKATVFLTFNYRTVSNSTLSHMSIVHL